MGCKQIVYVSDDGYKGVLYDYHNDPYCGWMYQMLIYAPSGREIMHSYNAKPKTIKELMEVVNIVMDEELKARKVGEVGWQTGKL